MWSWFSDSDQEEADNLHDLTFFEHFCIFVL
jgi:hypothetical protein